MRCPLATGRARGSSRTAPGSGLGERLMRTPRHQLPAACRSKIHFGFHFGSLSLWNGLSEARHPLPASVPRRPRASLVSKRQLGTPRRYGRSHSVKTSGTSELCFGGAAVSAAAEQAQCASARHAWRNVGQNVELATVSARPGRAPQRLPIRSAIGYQFGDPPLGRRVRPASCVRPPMLPSSSLAFGPGSRSKLPECR